MVIRIAVVVIVVMRVRIQRTALPLHALPLRMRMRIHTGDGVGDRAIDSWVAFASVVVVVIAVIPLVEGGRGCALTLGLSLRFGRSSSYGWRRTAVC